MESCVSRRACAIGTKPPVLCGDDAIFGGNAAAQQRIRAEQNSGVEEVAQNRAAEKRQPGDVALEQPGKRLGIKRGTPPGEQVSDEVELHAAREYNQADAPHFGGVPQENAAEQDIHEEASVNDERAP